MYLVPMMSYWLRRSITVYIYALKSCGTVQYNIIIIIAVVQWNLSNLYTLRTSLIWTPLGQKKVSRLVMRTPTVHVHTQDKFVCT